MNKTKLFLLLIFLLFVSLVSAAQTFKATETKYRGALYGNEGQFPCGDNCWVHDCAWVSSRVNVAGAGTYDVRMKLIRDGSEQFNENIRLEVNGKSYYHLDDGSYEIYHNFGPFYFNNGYNEIKFSSTRYGDFFYKTRKEDCYYGSVHFNEFTLIKCPDTDNDDICDYYDYCIGQNYANLPDDTACRNWFINEIGCHDYTNKEYGYVINTIDCDYLDTVCRDYHDSADICNGYGGIIYGSCDDYDNKPFGTSCSDSYFEYGCYAGTFLGSDVFSRFHEFYCNGYGSCIEEIDNWEIYNYCLEDEFCYVDKNNNVGCKNSTEENFCPILPEIEDMVALEGDLIILDINATDLNGDDLVFYYSSPFDSNGEWLTNYKDSGNYTMEVNVSDGQCQDSWAFNLEVLNNKELDLYCFSEFNKSDSDVEIKSVEINDIDIYENIDDRLAIERGQELFIKIRFKALKNISEVQIESYLDLSWTYDYENISDKTVWFDIVKATTYTRELMLNIPDDLEEDDYRLKIIFYDREGVMDICNYNFKVTLPIYSIVIKKIKLTPEIVKAGRVIIADVEIKNIGNSSVENIDVVASISDFNIKDAENIDELEPRDTYTVKDLVLRIPACTEGGEYFVKASAEYEYEKVTKVKSFEVREGEGCSDAPEEADELKVIPEAENIVQGDVEIPYTIIITNPTERRKTYIINIDGVDVFGSYRLEPSNVLIIPGMKSQVAYLYVRADISDITGPNPIVVTAKSDKELKETVSANIIKAEKETCWARFCNYIKSTIWYTFFLLFLIIIVFLMVLFFLLKRDDEEKEK